MLVKLKASGESFRADQAGIDQLKNEFLQEAREFLYYRKGGWNGAAASVEHSVAWAESHPEWVSTAVAMYKPSEETVAWIAGALGWTVEETRKNMARYFAGRKNRHVTRRVIVGEGIDMALVEKWEAVSGKGSVAIVPASEKGLLRYVVNEKGYALFTRIGADDLRGILGRAPEMVQALREMFDREFVVARERRRDKATR